MKSDRNRRLLVVDDDPGVVDFLVEMLEEAGHSALGVTDAGQAWMPSPKNPSTW